MLLESHPIDITVDEKANAAPARTTSILGDFGPFGLFPLALSRKYPNMRVSLLADSARSSWQVGNNNTD